MSWTTSNLIRRRAYLDLLLRAVAGRSRENAGPHRVSLVQSGCWWLPSHPALHEHQSVPPAPLCLLFLPPRRAQLAPTWQKRGSERESGRGLSRRNPQECPKLAGRQTTQPQNPAFELGPPPVPQISRHRQTLCYTISAHRPPKLPLGR